MKKTLFILTIGLLISCEEEVLLISEDYNDKAVYEGVFLRSSPNAKYESADVTLLFEKNTFSGTSSEDRYPAICHGTFNIKDGNIEFNDECFWTADFDWTLILSGAWKITSTSDSLYLTRKLGQITDQFELKKSK